MIKNKISIKFLGGSMLFIIFILLMMGIVMADRMLYTYVKPLPKQANTAFEYVFNFTTDSDCSNVQLSLNETITTDSEGVGFVRLNVSSLTVMTNHMCEYRSGTLRAVHNISDQIFKDVYAGNVNATNMTLGQKITFALGGIIENVVDKWINITGNINLGNYNLTTTGFGQFAWTDLLEGAEPPTPPADTLRLYAIEQDGFSRFNYKDELGVSRTLNDDEIIVNNSRGSTIAKHRLVYVTGHDKGVPTVDLAQSNSTTTMPSVCVTIESIADNELGRCMMTGLIQDVNTDAYNTGTIYVSDFTAGIPTNTVPITPNLTQEIGTILVKDAALGEIQIISRALTGDEYGTINNFIVTGNVTAENVFIPQYIFSHTNATIPVLGASIWTNITFEQEDTDVKFGISHTYNDLTNDTFTILESGIYNIDYDLDVEDTSASASDIDVASRGIYENGTELIGSVFESDVTKQGTEVEISHNFLCRLNAGDKIIFQVVANDADVQISTHGTFGDYPESATILMQKIANI